MDRETQDLRPVTLPVNKILKSLPTSPHIQQPSDSKGRLVVDE